MWCRMVSASARAPFWRKDVYKRQRQLRAWIEQPLVDSSVINQRLDAVEALYNANVTRADLKEALSHVYDIERLTTRILYGSATPKEVKALGDTCVYLPQVRQLARQLSLIHISSLRLCSPI